MDDVRTAVETRFPSSFRDLGATDRLRPVQRQRGIAARKVARIVRRLEIVLDGQPAVFQRLDVVQDGVGCALHGG